MFEMGTGVTSSLLSPDFLLVDFPSDCVAARILRCSCTFVHSVPRYSRALSAAKSPAQFLDCGFLHAIFHILYPENYIKVSNWSVNHWSRFRPISIGQLHVSPHLHLRPINVIVSHGSYHYWGRSFLVGGFALRCFQRLSRPQVATQLCSWQNNWCTRATSIPVLSY